MQFEQLPEQPVDWPDVQAELLQHAVDLEHDADPAHWQAFEDELLTKLPVDHPKLRGEDEIYHLFTQHIAADKLRVELKDGRIVPKEQPSMPPMLAS